MLGPGNNAEGQRYGHRPSALKGGETTRLIPAEDSITTRNEDLLRLQRKLQKRKSARIDLHDLDGSIELFINPIYVMFLKESDSIKNISQIVDEILYTLEQDEEASTSHRARTEPQWRMQLRSRTNDQVGRMVGELYQEILRHCNSSTGRWSYKCVRCASYFATGVMLRGHEDLIHKKISVNGIKPWYMSMSIGQPIKNQR